MTYNELVDELRKRHLKGKLHKVSMAEVHLFGLEFADDLNQYSEPELQELSKDAIGKTSLAIELSKMRKIGKYVTVNSRPLLSLLGDLSDFDTKRR